MFNPCAASRAEGRVDHSSYPGMLVGSQGTQNDSEEAVILAISVTRGGQE